jgi:hypothetical protein
MAGRSGLPEGTAGTKWGAGKSKRPRPPAVRRAKAGEVVTRYKGDPVPLEAPPAPVLRYRQVPGGNYERGLAGKQVP